MVYIFRKLLFSLSELLKVALFVKFRKKNYPRNTRNLCLYMVEFTPSTFSQMGLIRPRFTRDKILRTKT